MVGEFLKQFKTSFKEETLNIDEADVKNYIKKEVYNNSAPVYGNGAGDQMDKLIVRAEALGLNNFGDLKNQENNQKIKESAEAIVYLLETNKNIDKSLYKDRKFVCGPGTLTNLQGVIADICGITTSLGTLVSRYKKEMLEGLAIDILKGARNDDNEKVLQTFEVIGGPFEVHEVSTILNVLAEDYGIKQKTQREDRYISNITNLTERDRIKKYVDEKVSAILSNHDDLAEAIVSKLEVDLPEFDRTEINDEKYIKKFAELLDVWTENKSMGEFFGFLKAYNINGLLTNQALKLSTGIIEVYGYKDNFKETLKNCTKLYLDKEKLIGLQDAEKEVIIEKLKIENEVKFEIEGQIPDTMLKYAIDTDNFIINNTTPVPANDTSIDPIKEYLNSNDGQKKDYATKHIEANCEKYGGDSREIINAIKNSNQFDITYAENIKEQRYNKESESFKLLQAVKDGKLEEVETLLNVAMNNGKLPDELKKQYGGGKNIFHYATEKGNVEIFNKLLNFANQANQASKPDSFFTSFSNISSSKKKQNTLSELLGNKDNDNMDPLCHAIKGGNVEIFNTVLSEIGKLKILKRSLSDATLLREAIKGGNIEIFNTVLSEMSKLGILKNSLNDVTLLREAIKGGNVEIFNTVLSEMSKLGILKNSLNDVTLLREAIKGGNVEIFNTVLSEIGKLGILKNSLNDVTLLRDAIKGGNAEIFNTVLSEMSKLGILNLQNNNLQNNYFLANIFAWTFREGNVEIFSKLVNFAQDNNIDLFQDSIITFVINEGNATILPKFIEQASENESALMIIGERLLSSKTLEKIPTLIGQIKGMDGFDKIVRSIIAVVMYYRVVDSPQVDKVLQAVPIKNLINNGVDLETKHFIKQFPEFIKANKEMFNNVKNEITPAKWSNYIPDGWVNKVSEKGTYHVERDALVKEIITTYIGDNNYSMRDVIEKKDEIMSKTKEILNNNKEEIKEFLNRNYNVDKSIISIGSGGLFGKGFLKGSQNQLDFLPENHTDFIFGLIAEEGGFVLCLLLLIIYSLIIAILYIISIQCYSHFYRIFILGFASLLFFHILINIGMISGLLPVVGVPLPLLSYGGSNYLAIMIGIGLCINIYFNKTKLLPKGC